MTQPESEREVQDQRRHYGPTQIREIEGIRVGAEYIIHRLWRTLKEPYPRVDRQERIKVIQPPYRNEDGNWRVKVLRNLEEIAWETEISLAECGVVPYEKNEYGKWITFCWLEEPEKVKPEQ